ncbi:MAG: ammonium transporter [Armatimonadota bacterium]|nr:ammonium transporter [bacterium]
MGGLVFRARMLLATLGAVVFCLLLSSGVAFADSAGKINAGDTAWVLVSSALVMFMTPGLALFYAGMVRRKNALGTILQSFAMVGIIGLLWVVYGYSLAFGTDHFGFIGSLEWAGLRNVGVAPNLDYAPTIPHQAFVIFQAMFAIITPALITGAFAERMRFKAFVIFSIVWFTVVYCPVAHWVWGTGGWLRNYGALDFAGGIVVHISSGISALCCAIMLGRRKGFNREEFKPHNLTMTLIGTGMLWFGWFGFNAGSALAANGIATGAFLATNTAGATAAVAWMMLEWCHRGKPTALGVATGAIAGLAAVTPASGFITPVASIAIGAIVSVICYFAIMLKGKFGYDDSLDVFGVHGVGGIWGVIAVGLFATGAINPVVKTNGLFLGGSELLLKQTVAAVTVAGYSFVMTFIALKVIGVITPLRVEKDDEETGLDLTQHGEVGYSL